MTPIQFTILLPNGAPVANSEVTIQLMDGAFNATDTGVVLPSPVTFTTDSQGKGTVSLWATDTPYFLSATDAASGSGVGFKFVVPASGGTLRFQDLIVADSYGTGIPNNAYDQANFEADATAKVAAAAASATAAATSATSAAASAASATGAVNGLATNVAALTDTVSKVGGSLAITGLPADGSTTDAGPVFNAVTTVGGTAAAAKRTAVKMPDSRTVFTSRIDLDPSVSWVNGARGNTVIKAMPNMPAVTEGPSYNAVTAPSGTGGAPNSVIRLRRNSPVAAGSLSYYPEISGIFVNGNKAAQTYAIDGLRVPQSQPSKNSHDPDPNYSSNKDNYAPRVKSSSFNSCSGNGITIEGGNGAAYIQDVQTIGNAGMGILLQGNDPVVGERVGTGTNGGHAIQFGQVSGGLAPGGANVWGGPSRSLSAVGVFYNNTSGGLFNNNVLQDTIRLSPSATRGIHVGGNLMVPLESVFTGPTEGLALDVSNSNDKRLKCWVSVEGGSLNSFLGTNVYARTSPVAYPTAGGTDGAAGDTFLYLVNVMGAAEHGAILNFSSHPGVKPFTAVTDLPVSVQGGWAMGLVLDQHRGMVRNYALGAATTTNGDSYDAYFMWGSNRTKDYTNGYLGEIGETGDRVRFYGTSEFDAAVAYRSNALDGRVMTEGLVRPIRAGQKMQRCSVAGGGLTTAGFTLPTDMTASQDLDIILTGGPIGTLTWGFVGAGSLNANSPPLPTATGGFLFLALWYDQSLNQWFVKSSVSDRAFVGRRDGSAPTAGAVGESLLVNVNSGAAVPLTTNVAANVASLTLPPGEYDVTATQVFIGNAAVPTLVKGGISTTTGVIVATSADAYASRALNLAATSQDFETLKEGPVRMNLSVTTTIYNVAKVTYTGTGVSVYGNLKARRVA